MNDKLKTVQNYIHALEKALVAGDATEHTHRPALKAFIEDFSTGVIATNEPKHIECGAPDFILRKGSVTIGYIEAKDIGKSLDEVEKSDQLKRYRDSLTNLILTDYLEFRWYVDGECRLKARFSYYYFLKATPSQMVAGLAPRTFQYPLRTLDCSPESRPSS